MSKGDFVFTSESVSEGHPDKVCDRISDTVVDAFLAADPVARVACETLVTTNRIVIAGEVRGPRSLVNKNGTVKKEKIEAIARRAVKEIGYEQRGFHWKKAKVDIYLHSQSVDIAQGVDASGNKDEGAGDQGIMFGYACDETKELMPAPLQFAHNILRAMKDARHRGDEPLLLPDAKSQVTLQYVKGVPVRATAVVVSSQHVATWPKGPKKGQEIDQDDVRAVVEPYVRDALPDGWMCDRANFYVNPTGKFVIGGPDGDAGLTGRKIIVDTYGGAAPHGGGAFSGKDPTKVDRSAAYAARYLAKNVVASGLARRCTIQLSYAIGVSRPLSVYVDTHATGNVDEQKLGRVLQDLVNLSPRGIREHLKLNRPIYARTSAYGHFGRAPEPDGGFSWERVDLVGKLKSAFNVR
ncbi:MAG: methionine adenosyltransferase [Alphaproteobacteria bacterium]